MSRKNILVVDDEKSQREILEMILAGEGYDVTTAASGEAALKFAKDRRFDLALTDLKMTGMDGIELLQHLLAYDSSRSEEHTSELQSQSNLVCRLLLEKKKKHSILYRFNYIIF